jgi:lipopolysaccharide heptosyltransferase III
MLISSGHKLNITPKKILVIQLGDIGDVVWAIPTFQALKAAFPHAELSVLTRKPYGDLLLDDTSIKNVLQTGYDNIFVQLQFLLRLRRNKFDLLFDLRADERGTFLSFLSGVKTRCALFYPGWKWRNRAFTHLVDPPSKKEKILGAAEQSLKIIRGFGIKEVTNIPKIFVSQEIKDKTAALITMEKVDTSQGFVTINPFSRWSYKEWTMNKWQQIISFVWEKYKMPVLIIGSREEKKRADELAAWVNCNIYNFTGKTNLRELAALLQMSRLHVGVDSAAPQIAAAVGTPTLTIYGPSDWRDWAPPGKSNKVVLPDMDCSPCYKKGCNNSGYSECLDKLPASKVIDAVRQMLDNNLAISTKPVEVIE